MATAAILSKKSDDEDDKKVSKLKDLWWDQLIKYLASFLAIGSLLDVVVQELGGNATFCLLPTERVNATVEVTRDDVIYINKFCGKYLPFFDYYPLFLFLEGVLLIVPHILWVILFSGTLDENFQILKNMEKLSSARHKENIVICKGIMQQLKRGKSVFGFYVVKLVTQLLFVTGFFIIAILFLALVDFDSSFTCPPDSFFTSPAKYNNIWWFSFNVSCVAPSFRVYEKFNYINIGLIVVAFVIILYGIIWCSKRHVNALGSDFVAKMFYCSTVKLIPRSGWYPLSKYRSGWYPRIRNDLDFLVVQMFKSNRGLGTQFKNVQVELEVQKLIDADHSLLDDFIQKVKEDSPSATPGLAPLRGLSAPPPPPPAGGRAQECKYIQDYYRTKKYYTSNGEQSNTSSGEQCTEKKIAEALGLQVVHKEAIERNNSSIRSIIYPKFSMAKTDSVAVEISFGSICYSHILARGFKRVISLNLSSNEDKLLINTESYFDITTVEVPQNFTELTEILDKKDVFPDSHSKIFFIVIGPLTSKRMSSKVNRILEKMKSNSQIGEACVLLSISPTKIGSDDMNDIYSAYTPPRYFRAAEASNGELVQMDECVRLAPQDEPVTCHMIQCTFVMYLFSFNPSTT